ncbi:TnsD family Tn7-like transposition protein [Bradyrhizobium japonicum]|uniref:TnsD family Tn7-like transposition protein n=2 Tax=Bradyrhizobium japonicum TaxID=375 RepID=UPI0004569575|nr:Tn7-like transposition protein D [Bradyrhizobium japonicum SEMIA 5079]
MLRTVSSSDVINQHTMLPFYGRFHSSSDVAKCMKAMGSEGKGIVTTKLGLQAQRYVRFPTFMRFCRSCVQNDLSTFGETFWRRSHQISGALVCAAHGETLRVSRAEVVAKTSRLQDATAFADLKCAPQCASLEDGERVLARRVATRCVEFLGAVGTAWNAVDVHLQYRRAAIRCGYSHETGNPRFVSHRQLVLDFTNVFSQELIMKMGCCNTNLVDHDSWLKRIFRPSQVHLNPFLHALVQIFLEEKLRQTPSGAVAGMSDESMIGEWKCPNVYAHHDNLFRIPMVERRWQSRLKKWHFAAVCSCGFGFSFREGTAADPLVPKISKVSMWGPYIAMEVKRLKDNGLSIKKVASQMSMSVETAARLAAGKASKFERARDERSITELRKDWLKKRSKDVYDKLYKLDRVWLTTLGKSGWHGSTGPKKDWQALDKACASVIRSAIVALRSKPGSKQLSYAALERECGIKNLNSKSARMPRCARILSKSRVGRVATKGSLAH